ncbi:Maf family protein [Nitrospina sp. 32_T5]|uniref:Maf family protein n=1 Tax=unclassified Nitrospina TaxID=2638683 RepID=UPI003F9D97A8
MTDSNPKLILASQSPRRIDLLRRMELKFEIIPASVDEVTDPTLPPEENVKALAYQKAEHVARTHPGSFVLGADTIVVLEDRLLGKPQNVKDAEAMLNELSGRAHRVITGVALIDPEGVHSGHAEVSTVLIKKLDLETIRRYIEGGEPMDKAGAYAIQGVGAELVESWSGSWTNIVGLPVEAVSRLLKQAGFPHCPNTENIETL